MLPVHILFGGKHQRHTAVANPFVQQYDLFLFPAGAALASCFKIQGTAEYFRRAVLQRAPHLHIGFRLLPCLCNYIIQIYAARAVAEIQGRYVRFGTIACQMDLHLCKHTGRSDFRPRVINLRVLFSRYRYTAGSGFIRGKQLQLNQLERAAFRYVGCNFRPLFRSVGDHLSNMLPCRNFNLRFTDRRWQRLYFFRQIRFVDPKPAPGRHRKGTEYFFFHVCYLIPCCQPIPG